VDFSSESKATVPFVREFVCRFRASLTLLHAIDFPLDHHPADIHDLSTADAVEQRRRASEMTLSRFAAEQFPDMPGVQTICAWGLPGDAILAHAQASNTDLIMMPTHAHTALGTLIIGSVTTRILHRAACAVWTGAHLDGARLAEHVRVERILCALDLEKDSIDVVASAVELSDKLGAQIQILHCIPGAHAGPVRECDVAFEQFLSDYARRQLDSIQKKAGTSCAVSLAGGAVPAGVRNAALANGTDLLVIGRGHAQAPLARLRSNAYAIIREAPCPVISI
jgi:nucleotide-binding universal stress UspA family protein